MDKITLKAEDRKVVGRKVKKLRSEGLLPANIYGKKTKSQAVQLPLKEFLAVFDKAGENSIVNLEVGKETKPVLIHNIQKDPVTDIVVHADFYQVDLKQKVTSNIPVEVVGEAPAEKQGLGTVVQYLDEIEIEALPGDLPEKFEIAASVFTEVDKAVFVKDLKFDKAKIEIMIDPEQIIAKVEAQKVEVEPEVVPVAEEGTSVPPGEETVTEEKGASETPEETK